MSDVPLPQLPAWSKRLAVCGVFLLVAVFAYGTSLTNRFVAWDDTYLVYFNPVVKSISLSTLKTAFTTYDPELYIPLTLISYQIDYLIAGLTPFMYHLTSLLLHAGSALLVAWLLYLLSRRTLVAVLCGLLFLVHPLHVEAVAWISGRKDVLSTFLFLASTVAYVSWRRDGKKAEYGASVGLFALSLLAKVVSVTLPVVLILIDVLQGRKLTDAKMWLEKLPYLALSAIFGMIAVFGKSDITAASTLTEKLLMACLSTVFYVQKLFVPTGLGVIYPYLKTVTVTNTDFLIPLLLVAAACIGSLFLWRRLRVVPVAVAFFLVTLAPTFINFIKGGDMYFASDRYAYIPSIAVFALVGLVISRLTELPHRENAKNRAYTAAVTGSGIVIFLLTLLTFRQAAVWENSETLFLNTLRTYPDAIAARINLATIYRESDRLAESEEQLQAALKIRPHSRVYSNLAALEKKKGNLARAYALYEEGAKVNPKDPEPVFGMGIMEAQAGNTEKAKVFYEKALSLNPGFAGVHNNLGALYMEQENFAEAERQYRLALAIDPYFPDSHYNIAYMQELQGKTEDAIRSYETALTFDPRGTDIHIQLSALYVKTGRLNDAIDLMQTAITIDPDSTTVQQATLDTIRAVVAKDETNNAAATLLEELMRRGIVQRRNR